MVAAKGLCVMVSFSPLSTRHTMTLVNVGCRIEPCSARLRTVQEGEREPPVATVSSGGLFGGGHVTLVDMSPIAIRMMSQS